MNRCVRSNEARAQSRPGCSGRYRRRCCWPPASKCNSPETKPARDLLAQRRLQAVIGGRAGEFVVRQRRGRLAEDRHAQAGIDRRVGGDAVAPDGRDSRAAAGSVRARSVGIRRASRHSRRRGEVWTRTARSGSIAGAAELYSGPATRSESCEVGVRGTKPSVVAGKGAWRLERLLLESELLKPCAKAAK